MLTDAFGAFDARRQDAADQRENSPRLAVSQHTYDTAGVGDVVVAAPIRFQVTFVGEPYLSTGVALTQAPNATYLTQFTLPMVTAGIYRWVLDERGLFVAAHVFFAIRQDAKDPAVVPRPRLTHFLSFTGLGMKALDLADLTADTTVTPRSMNL